MSGEHSTSTALLVLVLCGEVRCGGVHKSERGKTGRENGCVDGAAREGEEGRWDGVGSGSV